MTLITRLYDRWFISFSWVIAFVLLCMIAYEQGLKRIDEEYQQLHDLYVNLELEKSQALAHQQELTGQINSQSDQQWLEMVLMQGLGLVPEGQTKIYFSPDVTAIQ